MRAAEPALPIELCLPELIEALERCGMAVLQAPPGAGKTTRVPLALMASGLAIGDRILMLEPRRLAARAAARRLAGQLGETPGQSIGLVTRHERLTGPGTRVEVITEGVLTRRLQRDPSLEGIGIVIFDEFHERNLQADLGLALCLQSRELLRPELRILVMSATLDTAAVGTLMGDAPVISSQGRGHPVDIRFKGPLPDSRNPGPAVTHAVLEALDRHTGSCLVFLPGRREIEQVARALEIRVGAGVSICPLYGQLSPEAQDTAIRPAPEGRRKVVLATDIAETSLTIDGIRIVVDAGFARRPRFDPRSGLTRLHTVRISRASADQRCGRAGRTEPGVCIRLWPEETHARLAHHATAEILEADLTPLALTLACWGAEAADLAWLTAPPEAALAQARTLLQGLGALDRSGRATAHGRTLENLGTHPRLGHMLLGARERGLGRTACLMAALLEERDPLRRDSGCDLRLRLRILLPGGRHRPDGVHAGALKRIRTLAQRWSDQLDIDPGETVDPEAAGILLAMAYPDRIALRRSGPGNRFLTASGRGARFMDSEDLAAAQCVVAASLDDAERDAVIRLAAPLDRGRLEQDLADLVTHHEVLAWDDAEGAVIARREHRLGALPLGSQPLETVDPDAVTRVLVDAIRARGLRVLPWDAASVRLRERMAFAHALEPQGGWPDVSDTALLNELQHWLGPFLMGMSRLSHLRRLDLHGALRTLLDRPRQQRLDNLAPGHVSVPSGSRPGIDYSDPQAPVLAVRIQEVFGLQDTPRIGAGRVPLTLHLLSPARRPVQVTRDLAGFWARTYGEVKKELKGRYPKHHWPDDPVRAVAVSGVKKKMKDT